MPEIVLEHLVKDFGNGCFASNDLNLTVKDGEYLCILGPTGSGKTTTLRTICGLTIPDSGRVLFDGQDMADVHISERKATMLSQVYSLFPPKTVYDNVMFAPKIKKWNQDASKQLVKSMIDMVHMTNKVQSYPHELSGGQQQRTALARALASNSDVLLLDEPLRALDARLRLELRKDLKSMVKEMGLTSIHVTHDQDEALEMADRIAIIRNGKIIQIGTPRDVFENPATPFVANFVGRSNIMVGTMYNHTPEYSTIKLDNGSFIRARCSDIPKGTEVAVAIKIGSVILAHYEKVDEDSDFFFVGEIERILYEGATITVEINVKGLGTISAKLSNRKFDDYKEGDKVTVSWNSDKGSVFNIPECGMEEELRLD